MAKYTQTDLENIKGIISGGLKQAMIAGEMVQYRDLGELTRIKRMIEADLEASAARPVLSVGYVSTDRGV